MWLPSGNIKPRSSTEGLSDILPLHHMASHRFPNRAINLGGIYEMESLVHYGIVSVTDASCFIGERRPAGCVPVGIVELSGDNNMLRNLFVESPDPYYIRL